MSFFNNFLGSSSSEIPEFWQRITSLEELEAAIEKSQEKYVVLFKHSTRCIISKTVLRNFEKEVQNNHPHDFEFYYLDLLNYRNISNAIAEKLEVTHQSPQIIVLKNKEAIYNASHESISLNSINKKIHQ